jgi:uncharacterized protein (TIGR00369 family)
MSLKPVMTAEAIVAFWDEHFPQIQTARDLTLLSVGPAEAVLRLDPSEKHLRPGGTVSGPTLVTLADVAAYAALLAHVGPEPMIVTANLSINFLRRSPLAPLLATCRILKLGKRLGVVEVAIRPEAGGELIAQATGTYAIPSGRYKDTTYVSD